MKALPVKLAKTMTRVEISGSSRGRQIIARVEICAGRDVTGRGRKGSVPSSVIQPGAGQFGGEHYVAVRFPRNPTELARLESEGKLVLVEG